jgi:hypothetical protein
MSKKPTLAQRAVAMEPQTFKVSSRIRGPHLLTRVDQPAQPVEGHTTEVTNKVFQALRRGVYQPYDLTKRSGRKPSER